MLLSHIVYLTIFEIFLCEDGKMESRLIGKINSAEFLQNFCILGCTDTHGRPVLEFEDEPSRREALSVKEVSSFLLYLARLPR